MKKFLKKIIPFQIKSFINRHLVLEKAYWINKNFRGLRLKDQIIGASHDTYLKYKNYDEAEHQIGRFLNIKKVLKEVKNSSLKGDLVEFGTFQGLSLILFDIAISQKTKKKMVGIDSFEGLPETSTVWKKGRFSNTSTEMVYKNLNSNIKNFSKVELIKGWYNDPKVALKLYEKVKNVSIAHIDSDLGSSTTTALEILERYMIKRNSPMFILFDDWGIHPNEVPDAFNNWLENAKKKYKIRTEVIGSTRYTRYYKLIF